MVCIVVNGEKCQSHAVTMTLIRQCQMSNSAELFPYITICSSFNSPIIFELLCTQTHTDTHIDDMSTL